jgi:hypothetical protein
MFICFKDTPLCLYENTLLFYLVFSTSYCDQMVKSTKQSKVVEALTV